MAEGRAIPLRDLSAHIRYPWVCWVSGPVGAPSVLDAPRNSDHSREAATSIAWKASTGLFIEWINHPLAVANPSGDVWSGPLLSSQDLASG